MSELVLMVNGMTCGGCEGSVSRAVGLVPGVRSVTADHTQARVVVVFDGEPKEALVRAAIDDAGYEVA